MIRNHRLPDDILDRIHDASEYLAHRDEVIFAYLFGGLAKSPPKPLSDVDIAVYIRKEADWVKVKMEIFSDLVDILGTENIDLILLNQASLPLSFNVLKSNQTLVDKYPFERHAYQSLTMRKFFDHHLRESSILRRRFYHG